MSSFQKQALVVGVADYENLPALSHPGNDAEDMARLLRKFGFKVMLSVNPTLSEMEDDILSFLDSIKSKDCEVALIYYSGHGIQVNGENFLIPRDMKELDDERKIVRNTYALNDIFKGLESASNKVNILILDACRDNPFSKGTKSIGTQGGLAGIGSAPKGSFVAYATSPGEVAFDGNPKDRNGVFTGELLRVLQMEGLTIEEVFKEVRAGVLKATKEKQKPWDLSSLTGNFYFLPHPEGNGIARKANPELAQDTMDVREKILSIMAKFADPKTVDEAFNQFIDFAKDFAPAPSLLKKATDLKQDYLFLEEDHRGGLISSSEFRTERREILRQVTEVLDEIRRSL